VTGDFVSYCLLSLGNGDPAKSLLFATKFQENGPSLSASLTPLKISATSLKDTTGSAASGTAQVTGGAFQLALGMVAIPGDANPISGSDIELDNTVLKANIQSADRICAEVDGQLTKPFPFPIDDPGDICIILRVGADGTLPPRPEANGFICSPAVPPSGYDPADQQKYRTDPASAAVPPGPSAGSPPDGTQANIQAFSRIFLGDTDRQGTPSNDAWMSYGFDLDGLSSTETNTYHCQPVPGAKKKDVFVNGIGGVDNSFGRNIVQIIASVVSNPTDAITQSINNGEKEFLLALNKLGAKPDYSGMQTQFFAAQGEADASGHLVGPTSAQQADGSFTWHPFPELLAPDGSSKTLFPQSYLAGNTWVSGAFDATIPFPMTLQGIALFPLTIHHATIAMKLSDDHKTSVGGNIGGVLVTEEFIKAFQQVAGSLSSSLCSGSTFDSIAAQYRQASDIMSSGKQDPTATCDAISIGLGFETTAALLGDPAPPAQAIPNPCP
jgi:hypothetical protein